MLTLLVERLPMPWTTQPQRAKTTQKMVLPHAPALAVLTVPRMAPALAFAPRPLPPHRLYCQVSLLSYPSLAARHGAFGASERSEPAA